MTMTFDRRRVLALGTGFVGTAALAGCATAPAGPGDIVDVAVGAGTFTTLAAALEAAGLVDTLKGPGPFTVFAPTDAAFAALPAGTVENLLLPENRDQLTSILTYHVAPNTYPASALVNQRGSIPTVNGQSLHVDGTTGTVRVGRSASVITPDVGASNGVIHVIDAVLLP